MNDVVPPGPSDSNREPSPGPHTSLPAREIDSKLESEATDIDPWSHRRTEPRPLAFFWSMFLAVATLVALGSAAATGIVTHDVYRPAVRSVLGLIAIGLTVLWPMMRLSQSIPPVHTRVWIAKDIVVLLAPTQAVVWPQGFFFLAWWPWPVVAAISACLAVWTVLVGAILAIACDRLRSFPVRGRMTWMAVVLVVALAGPVAAVGLAPSPASTKPDLRLMTSAATAMFELGRDRAWTGKSAAVFPAHWWAIGVTLCVATLAWVVALPSSGPSSGARGSLGVGFKGGAGLDSMTTRISRAPSTDPGSPGAAEGGLSHGD